ncbi:hypothetical protein [Rhodococcus gordoniae]|uniref:hypothetical protein n=1 Tax=Rhodococcus gordoniae TaxID=223392 RepID=UPI0020CCFC18|nr:hypothetical protein [Rhodococcus gordoniae]UTT48862.1 hypothetical protein NMQ04_01150 [Rhodococcus gordoniae]
MKDIKLSLHPAKWRMAFTSEAAAVQVPEGSDRVISRWTPPAEFRPGWRRGALIHVLTSALGDGYPEKKVRGSGEVGWYPNPGPGQLFQFDVLLAQPSAEPFTLTNSIGDVAQFRLADGFGVWVTATLHETPPQFEEEVRSIHELSPGPGMAWGHNEDESPRLLDLSMSSA